MKIKASLKKILPITWVEWIRRHRVYRELRDSGRRESAVFARAYATPDGHDRIQLESLLIFYIHQIEKGFSFDKYQYGRGKNALQNIADLSRRLKEVDPTWAVNPVRADMVLALGEYRRRHVEAGMDITYMTELFDSSTNVDIDIASKKEYPNIEISIDEKKDNDSVSFRDLGERRHAIRSYSDEPVRRDELEKAIAMSLRTPSVCNRQPARVRIFTDKQQIQKALKIQGGFGGYNLPPALILVTADLRAFMGANEHNEGYVDGGLFAMSLLYSLEACKLAACPLNTMFNVDAERETRDLLDIPENEVFIMYIAVGHFRKMSKICRSQRYGLNHILIN
ncbi:MULTISPECIES: nitroreductase family protein [Bifidobacterium]|uniref:Nitroreductase domain-containing protein n=2 Tax=Bifidobacterium TaxID=1678 RepID=M4RQ24_9BIFI|nr:nitroreductase family protein [Bifidobacterium thermophilum]AGH40632.1 hypothetical protein D805_0365 [Bifidobacterium thermophilum RBL67]MDW8486845.1 nitroreductase family protein [Bifidobacterium thermophilum]